MPLPDKALPVRMRRIAVVAPEARLRETLVALAEDGGVELSGDLPALAGPEVDALRRLEHRTGGTRAAPQLSRAPLDLDAAVAHGDRAVLTGEAELARRAGAAIRHGPAAAFVGWTKAAEVEALRSRLAAPRRRGRRARAAALGRSSDAAAPAARRARVPSARRHLRRRPLRRHRSDAVRRHHVRAHVRHDVR